ncbi:TonB-dependent receptor [Siphonobacter sp. SORGH_AS_0500]|uniref:SusC/RagA family TonB-linked outer membrane protein n=1 Tax=Siphonobacter sp. SORGH_AS_0500 TaxID=1864824 RepID=UPI000CACBC12|nr:TonB-dependent receptor [Siphonobacter sp. SORGH_AS_0500]MDR6194451.1 TonB-linked SusC/RagA family outer membrane protein [Siphonobacter sp. SORGH_AS_0500]PKK37746.1 SusC/RagA family TonB-linked outer membrane protein [Siphonobacter sp. SORGH_AS_0500]
MRKLLLLCAFLGILLSGYSTIAQDHVVTGKVTSSEDGTALVGVSVQVKGSSQGVNSNADGEYRISVSPNATLVFSFVGMSRKEVVVGNQTVINVELGTDNQQLSEVVVTGFGSQIKREVTGNIAKIKGSDITNIPAVSIESALQGRAAGVVINQGSGKLGQGIQVRVRGASSLSASSQPLYVIDGIPVTSTDQSSFGGATNPLADINFNDVESVEVLKDASAAAIYGSRAANGVVLITTKRGNVGKTNISFNYQFGVSNPTRKVPFLSPKQYVDFYRMAAGNADRLDDIDPSDPGSSTAYMESFFESYSLGRYNNGVNEALNSGADYTRFVQSSDLATGTNWQDEAFRKNAGSQQADLTFSGGNEKTSFYISGQYLNQTGIIIGNNFERITGRINLDHKVSNILSIGMNMSLAHTLNKRLSGDRQFNNPIQAAALTPLSPAYDPTTGLPTGTPPGNTDVPNYYNPLINLGNIIQNQEVIRNLSNVYGQINILPSLKFRSELGIDVLSQQEERYFNSKTIRLTGQQNGTGDNLYTGVINYNTNNYFNFDKSFDLHTLSATVGMSYQNSATKANSVSAINFPSDAYRSIENAGTISGGSSSTTNFRFLSYFLRANYKFNDRYLLSASGRIDGSSRFGKNSKYGFFPAVSAGWVISEESFLKSNTNTAISFLKLRGSYGLTGNAEIGNFPSLGLYSSANYAGTGGQAPIQLANPNLKWETTTQADFGLDFGFLNNRINGEFDYYVKKTSDLLLNVNVPGTTGFYTQTRNVGSLENKGFELVINSQNFVGAFQWSTSLNLATNRNKITNIQKQIVEAGISSMSRAVEGQPIGTFFTVEYAGVDPTNGDALYYKNAANADGTIDRSTTNVYSQAQRVVVGNAIPKLTGGLNNTFSYKGIDLSVFLNGVAGNKINFYGVGQYSSANGIYEDNQTADQMNAWTSTNTNTKVPEARLFYSNGNNPSSRYIQDGSYLRLRTVTLGYNLPQTVVNRLKLKGIRVYLTGQNLLTWTKYTGWDPEVNADDIVSSVAQGYDFYTPPQAKTFLGGINIKF